MIRAKSSKLVQAGVQAIALVDVSTVLLATCEDPSGVPKLDVEGSSPFARSLLQFDKSRFNLLSPAAFLSSRVDVSDEIVHEKVCNP
jgi:hypothetical protein